MPIPEHVRRLAMDAVSHHETTTAIRALSGAETAPPRPPLEISAAPARPLTDKIRQLAMDAVSHSETFAAIRQLDLEDSIRPGHTPSVKNSIIAERIAEMHKSGQGVDAIQAAITKDNFGREYDIR